jgi:hypothetical protein
MDKNVIKKHILSADYGKFDFIHEVVPAEILLMAPPRIIVQYLVAELNIDKTKIHMPTLRSWLFNYRKKQKHQPAIKQPAVIPVADKKKGKAGFSFTDANETTSKKFDF